MLCQLVLLLALLALLTLRALALVFSIIGIYTVLRWLQALLLLVRNRLPVVWNRLWYLELG